MSVDPAAATSGAADFGCMESKNPKLDLPQSSTEFLDLFFFPSVFSLGFFGHRPTAVGPLVHFLPFASDTAEILGRRAARSGPKMSPKVKVQEKEAASPTIHQLGRTIGT